MQASRPSLRFLVLTCLLVAAGALGGQLATWAHLPMPWMLGSLTVSALIVLFWSPAPLQDYVFPNRLRSLFVALIGVMIGSQVTPELLTQAPGLVVTLSALLLFIALAHTGNYIIFRQLGGYDRATAFYSGTPGGLMESIVMGEAAGADIRILTAQQFLRIICVITLLPFGMSLWLGMPVGSAAGLAPGGNAAPVSPENLVLIGLAAVVGMFLAGRVHLPAGQLTGPLILAALATATGWLDLHLPFWLIAMAQLVIGVTLGLRFKGTDLALLRRCLWLSLISVLAMMTISAVFALVLHQLTGIAFLHLLISFAPGGVAEMSIVALSLAANPALVSLHHIARILMTVIEMPLVARMLGIIARSKT